MTGPTRRAAVLGHPVAHSLSPVLHRAAYRYLGLDWAYEAADVEPAALADFLAALDPSWVGLSLTMPLKETVLPLLTSVDPEAARLASVNTVLLDPAGGEQTRRHGTNTDVAGMVRVLAGCEAPAGRQVTVLGGGATARSTMGALAHHGAGEVVVCVRQAEVGDRLVRLGRDLGLDVAWRGFDRAGAALAAPLVVTTLPARAADHLAGELPDRPGQLVEVVYDPWPTALAVGWAAAGGRVVGGLELLVHQAVEQVRLMTGRPVPADVLRSAGSAALEARR
jgi:shikimate 5-dehydrogenase